jgi:hypothetical protein
MPKQGDKQPPSTKKGNTVAHKQPRMDNANMPKPEAKETVLEFMAEYDTPMPVAVLFRGLRLRYNWTYTDETLLNYLGELVDEGRVQRVDPNALEQRSIEQADSDTRAYYLLTDDTRAQISTD